MFDPSRQVNRYVPGRVEMYSFKKAAVVSGIGTALDIDLIDFCCFG